MPQQEEWKFVSVVSGVWCVITTGISETPELLAKNLDYHSNVSSIITQVNSIISTHLNGQTLDKKRVQFCCNVIDSLMNEKALKCKTLGA